MNDQPGSSLEERRERGLRLPEEMLGKTKAEEFKAALHGLCPDFEDYVSPARFGQDQVSTNGRRPGHCRKRQAMNAARHG